MKHILHITAHLGGGAGKAISGLIRNCCDYRNSVIMLEEPADRQWYEECEKAGAGISIAPSEEELIRAIENADAVILDWWAHPLMVGLLSLLDRIPARYILWSHINGLSFPVLKPEFLEEFDFDLFTSPCSFERVKENTGIAEELMKRTELLYGMGDFQPQCVPHKKEYSAGNPIRIGYIGTLDFAKMSPDYPDVCELIHELIPNAKFHLFGKYTENFEREFFSKKEIRKYVTLEGFVPDPGERYPTFDLFLYLLTKNNYATTENAILEAMAAGLPVVVYDNPPEKAIVEDGVTGIVVRSRNDAADAVKRLILHEEERKRIGTAARDFVIENYRANVNAKRFQDAVGRTLNQPKRLHHFADIVGRSLWERFLYICGEDRQNAEALAAGKSGSVPDCFKSGSKSSPAHFLKYYDDRNLTALAERICAEERNGSETGMKITETKIKGCFVIERDVFQDERGYFSRAFDKKTLEEAGMCADFVQSSISQNLRKHTLRGLHSLKAPYCEDKLVMCMRGRLRDVCVDVRPESPTYRQYVCMELSEENRRAFYIPKGCAHGFLTLEDDTQILYYMTHEFVPDSEMNYRFDDPAFHIDWGEDLSNITISEKDRNYQWME